MVKNPADMPERANRVLNCILVVMVLLIFRIWHLSVIQYDAKLEESRKPQQRVIVETAQRGTIRDRFNIPLAINKIQYRAAILYSQIKTIPAVRWEVAADGKRIKHASRREYIASLSKHLGDELQLDPERLEDLIHSKAALYDRRPFVIQERITEQQYHRLKMLEKDWPGIHVQRVSKRVYPWGKVGGDVLGYMGAINREEYEGIITELKALEEYVTAQENGDPFEALINGDDLELAKKRLLQLRELAYTANDYVGKAGIEGRFEQVLRGLQGKKRYFSDARGTFLRKLPGSRDPIPGQRLNLALSIELQEFAEQLLAQNERCRECADKRPSKQPWIRGGAIVAIDPQTGDVIALASYPRFDPNDYIVSGSPEIDAQKRSNIHRWFENEEYLAQLWDQRRPFERERFDLAKGTFYEESLLLTWDAYLEFILPAGSSVKEELKQIKTVHQAVVLQRAMDQLLESSGQNNAYWVLQVLYPGDEHKAYGKAITADIRRAIEENLALHEESVAKAKKELSRVFSNLKLDYDKVLLIDLCRVLVCEEAFSPQLDQAVGKQNFSEYRNASAAMSALELVVRPRVQSLFHKHHFKEWRAQNETAFLKNKRLEEKLHRRFPKPYIDYLDEQENLLFQEFWKTHRLPLMVMFLTGKGRSVPELAPYAQEMRSWHHELAGASNQTAPWSSSYKLLQALLKPIPVALLINYLDTLRSYHQLDRPLLGRYRNLRERPGKQLEKHLASAFYPAYGYGYGRSHAYRQVTAQGSLFKLVTAYTALYQSYEKKDPRRLAAALVNPLEMVDTYHKSGSKSFMGFHADGSPIPQFYKGGRLIKSCVAGIGQLDILRAIEYSSNPYFSLLAGEVIECPDDLVQTARDFSYGSRTGIDLSAEASGMMAEDVLKNRSDLYAMAIGQHGTVTPLQTAVMLSTVANGGKVMKPRIVKSCGGLPVPMEVRRELPMPLPVQGTLLEGMQRVVKRIHESGIGSLRHFYAEAPEAIRDYIDLKEQIIGKTSTAEIREQTSLDLLHGTNVETHVWFGGIAFDAPSAVHGSFLTRERAARPELVVVVYLRFGSYGKEAAPVAAQIVKRWRDIQAKHREGKEGVKNI